MNSVESNRTQSLPTIRTLGDHPKIGWVVRNSLFGGVYQKPPPKRHLNLGGVLFFHKAPLMFYRSTVQTVVERLNYRTRNVGGFLKLTNLVLVR
jgi:hypothetical protein